MKITLISLTFSLFILSCIPSSAQNTSTNYSWKAGVSSVKITPAEAMPMAGFASRTHSSEGTLHDIWAKALLIEDSKGKRAVMISSDLLGFPKIMSDPIRDRIKTQYGLGRDQILLNSSHTHSGPVIGDALSDVYVLDNQQVASVKKYSKILEDQIVKLVGDAIKNMEPVELFSQNGVTRFQVNRRNNNANLLTQLTELQGPNDFAVPVLKAVTAKGDLKAIAFGYACHPTVLSGYDWSGDYPGYAQIELEKDHPGTTALFFQSSGADQNPLPRHTAPLAKQYGRELAAAVDRVLEEDMRKLPSILITSYSELDLPLATSPTEAELTKIVNTSAVPYQKRWAQRFLNKIKAGEKLMTSYPYPVQVWSIGNLPLVSLGGELLVEYGIKIKQMLGEDTFVYGYSNDVMSYVPSSTVLKEGGYEGESAHTVYGLPSKWQVGVESRILNEVLRLAEKNGQIKNSK
ncbi:Neutral/alkaline non-lysosomal ceramidase, N-terminal [Daejeonella rubra]|uniref:Neutral/alkaline non-lysosomal ceramidase, N-terminal n=1 Tax=Daejeonella rubra TaxID=990371 RepID=A0A1G9S4L8_9SPHI|nr:neutral/alkaline non-lysosomal ceramidase N-terminal domain-containing protein [Daejeonella rubra]SDM30341.1 Neutral/alkaline non-lysosomal ceramidase, N-terminal [Daejeonella rubra]